ncbi:uncharacterized protein RCC_02972 [Ramularia collo-cygni]|uniref:Uncharacterized protein n=1 Tax=Ramularia collo-cygni TaxID=112498 RepID=A0A2D3UVQ7_9PEZI|nr:uncharacterized protein RCC_02972 [Ramularia collo-cygni]CZT17140.1 uncharacterized protein RCC_02972 [Ramularia collo-cygni]
MAPGSLKDCHIVVLKGNKFRGDYTMPNLKKWIESGGGHVEFKEVLTERTTHVVMDEDTWLDQGPFIQEILKAEIKGSSEQAGREIHIVSFDWLQECLDNRVKRRESLYRWKKLAGGVLKNSGRSPKEPGNTQGDMLATLMTETDRFMNAGLKKTVEKRKRVDAEERENELEMEAQQFIIHRKKMSIPEQAAVFKRGAKRARNDILSDNHHIFIDNTGFPLDVTITKVDIINNVNQRCVLTLQIYESNTVPSSYAFHCGFVGTATLPRNNIIAAIGSNFPTAFRAFKKTFKQYTKVEWDDRLLEVQQREAKAKAKRDEGAEIPFDELPFEYYPPTYGPLGELPLAQTEAMDALVKSMDADKKDALVQSLEAEKESRPLSVEDDDERKMSGGEGPGNVSPGFIEFMSSSAKESGFPPDDQLNGSPFAYPFAMGGRKDDAIVVEDDDDDEDEDTNPKAAFAPTSNNDTVTPLNTIYGAGSTPAERDDVSTQQVGTQSYQQTYEFDDELGLTQSTGFSELAVGSSQIPSQPPYVAQTQAFGQTQLAESALAWLLEDEQTQAGGNGAAGGS